MRCVFHGEPRIPECDVFVGQTTVDLSIVVNQHTEFPPQSTTLSTTIQGDDNYVVVADICMSDNSRTFWLLNTKTSKLLRNPKAISLREFQSQTGKPQMPTVFPTVFPAVFPTDLL